MMAGGLLEMLMGGGQQQPQNPMQPAPSYGGDFLDKIRDIGAGLAMGTDQNRSIAGAGMMLAQGNQSRRKLKLGQQQANKTVEWLKSAGVGDQEAAYLATDPDAMKAWYSEFKSGSKPDWKIQRLINGDGLEQDFMIDMKNPERKQALGAAKTGADKGPQVVSKGGIIYENGEWKTPPAGAGGAPQADFGDIAGVRKEVQGLPSYKNLAQAAPIWDSMVKTAGHDSKASDLNLVYGLGKIMDPTSVVREGEMIMVTDTAGMTDKVMGYINAVNGGARLTPEVRADIMKEAQTRIGSYKTAFDTDAKQFQGISDRYGINPEDILPNMPQIPDLPQAAPPAVPGGVQEGATATNPKTGQKIIFKGGQWVPQ